MSVAAGPFWPRGDAAAFGFLYRSIMVLSILMAVGGQQDAPLETAAVLFGSVLAITLAKTFAEFVSRALDTGQHLTRAGWRAAWQHGTPTLAAANLPTCLFVASGLGWVASGTALLASQAICIALLGAVGARLGWVLERRAMPAILGAVFAGAVGIALAVLKHVIH